MRYFETHEQVYAQRLARGKSGWDDGDFEAYAMREAIDAWRSATSLLQTGTRVLELGCGTGALSCELARLGCEVTALDVSASAVEFADRMARQRGLRVRFVATDATRWLADAQEYDLIIDAHMLHCLALAKDRAALLAGVRRALAPGGEFWTETMLGRDNLRLGPDQHLDAAGVLWIRMADAAGLPEARRRDDAWWLPCRYLAKDAVSLIAECAAAGLRLIEHDVMASPAGGVPDDFRARFA